MNTDHLTLQIDPVTAEFVDAFGALSAEQLNWKPDASTWSIAQNMDHLIVTNESYYPIVERIRAGEYRTPWTAKLGFLVSFFSKLVLDSVNPAQKRKSKTFPVWQPAQSALPADILERFKTHQQELKAFIRSCQDLIDQGVVVSSPANRFIVYKLETAFEVMILHEKRHLAQAKAVAALQVQ